MSKKIPIYSISILCITLMLSSCNYLNQSVSPSGKTNTVAEDSSLILSCEKAVNDLINNCNIVIDKSKPIIVTSLVNINDLNKSSSMGRMAGEIIANQLSQRGYIIKEMKMGQNKVFIKEGMGEFILSRKLKEIAKSYNVQAVVVGTYAIGEEIEVNQYGPRCYEALRKLYISLRIIETETNNIGCSVGYSMIIGDASFWQ